MRQGRSGRAPLVIFKREHNQLWAPTHPPPGNEIRGGAHNALGTTRVRGTVLRDLGWREREPFFSNPKILRARFAFLMLTTGFFVENSIFD